MYSVEVWLARVGEACSQKRIAWQEMGQSLQRQGLLKGQSLVSGQNRWALAERGRIWPMNEQVLAKKE